MANRGAGDPSTDFDRFVASTTAPLLRLAFARTGSRADAEDLVQDALAAAHARWSVIGAYDDPTQWARRAVLNRSVSRWRRRGRERAAVERMAAQPHIAERAEPMLADTELWNAVRSLTDRQRDVVLLLWFEDLPVSEVAATLECGEETVRTHWRRARAKLAQRLGERDDLEDEL